MTDGLVDLLALDRWMEGEGVGEGPVEDPAVLTGGTQKVLLRFRRAGRELIIRIPPVRDRQAAPRNLSYHDVPGYECGLQGLGDLRPGSMPSVHWSAQARACAGLVPASEDGFLHAAALRLVDQADEMAL